MKKNKDQYRTDSLSLRIVLPAVLTVVLVLLAVLLFILPLVEDNIISRKQETCQRLVESSIQILNHYHSIEESGRITEEEARIEASELIRQMRFGKEGKDYFWIHDQNMRMVMHPYRPDLEGQDVSELKDADGRYLFRDMARTIDQARRGQIQYKWQWQDNPERIEDKTSFIQLFEPWGWVVGTGLYVDDVQADMSVLRQRLLLISGLVLILVMGLGLYMFISARRHDLNRETQERARRALMEALSREEEKYRQLVDNLPLGVALIGPASEIITVNRKMREWFPEVGERDRVLCRYWPGIGLEETAEGGMCEATAMSEVLSTESVRGKAMLFRITCVPFDQGGEGAGGGIVMLEDVTERVRAEDKLREAETKYRKIFDNVVKGIFQSTPEGEWISLNPAMAHMLGYDDPKELMELGGASEDFIADPAKSREFVRLMEEHGKVENFEFKIRAKDGCIRWVSEDARAVRDESGQVRFYEGVITDITDRKQAEEKLRKSEALLQDTQRIARLGGWELDVTSKVITCTEEVYRILGLPRDSGMTLKQAQNSVVDEDREWVTKAVVHSMKTGDPLNYEARLKATWGEVRWVRCQGNAIMENGEVVKMSGMMQDITKRKTDELELNRQRAYFKELFDSSPLAIVLIDFDGRVLDANKGFEKLFGYNANDIRGHFNKMVVIPEELMSEAELFRSTLLAGHSIHKDTLRVNADGNKIQVSVVGYPIRVDGNVAGFYYIYQDITERKKFEDQLSHQAFHDPLTSLPNRTLFMERLTRAVQRGKRRHNYNFAALMVDLNRFKTVNDTLGHQAGDQLLVGIGIRLASCVRAVDTVARLGGDEFAVLLEEYETPREVIQVARRINDVLEEPFIIDGNEVYTGASIGIVLDTRGYDRGDDILRDADIAMYKAKELKKQRMVFNRRMHEKAVRVGRMESELRTALEKDEFVLYYQPIFSLRRKILTGFEALVRWNHPKRGLIPPLDFIPLAEETGLIIPLGRWVLREACGQMARWMDELPGAHELAVSVNVSGRQFQQHDLVEYVSTVLEEFELKPSALKLEITESVIMQDSQATMGKLSRLKGLGVQLMIDDFGTGYSSLSYLQQFPVDYIKIDRSFISGEGDSEENAEIVRTIVALAKTLGLTTVAEGVEEIEQLDLLTELKCDKAQGFMFSRPVEKGTAQEMIQGKVTLDDMNTEKSGEEN